MAIILYEDENGARVEDDDTGEICLNIPKARLLQLKKTAITDGLRAILPSGVLRRGTFVCDNRGIETVGMASFERAFYSATAPKDRFAGRR